MSLKGKLTIHKQFNKKIYNTHLHQASHSIHFMKEKS